MNHNIQRANALVQRFMCHYTSLALNLIQRTVDPDGKPVFEVMRELTSAEEQLYASASGRLSEFQQSRLLMALVESNLAEARGALHALELATRQDALTGAGSSYGLVLTLNGKIVDYLTATRLYLEHRRIQLKRRYGPEGNPLQAFDAERHHLFESEPVYAFIYKLRNYVQHCGMPIQASEASASLVVDEAGERSVHTLFVGCRRDELLADYSEWGRARTFIATQDDVFEILPLLETNTKLLWKIERASVAAEMEHLWRDARAIASILAEVADDDHWATVAEVMYNVDQTDVHTLAFHGPPLTVLRTLRLIRDRSPGPGWRLDRRVLASEAPPEVT